MIDILYQVALIISAFFFAYSFLRTTSNALNYNVRGYDMKPN